MATQGTPGRFVFPRPMTDRPGLDFSFSGLKTFAANTIHAEGQDEQTRADIAHAFQTAVVDTLAIKCRRALKETGLRRLVIAGGVSANTQLREQLASMMAELKGEVADLSVAVAGKILGSSITKADHEALIDKYLAEVGSLNEN